ncbi:phosphoglycerate mutase (2,3-diphosphoglycerate-independent) [Aliifodinibius salipaludis]|uniref:2,3-bisphosphoglycerate-independent phosphoglycerate mutase n=1 Tax=Fodinibius salipaludis TaxID=2032627 RepID=A0A2A2G8G1_9BACT|nr:2,3-bisphosphoglycerate-independent phosphoglycerate mutase [Aliifodinibius salipaludis]PAU93139.1 phosphoglycerate mutase (2,3-diphosphoglycerate-independent) [Aliifodinibius salipaludis]
MADPYSKALLVILDGFGLADNPEVSAIDKAHKPFIDSLFANNSHSKLSASGKDVGLPDGQFGNSEVGHLNIGAGRIVPQELTRVNTSIKDGSLFENNVLTTAFEKAKKNGRVHIMGLFSDGGVHSHNEHLFALLKFAQSAGIDNTYVHAFTDGRDTSPHGGIDYVKEFQQQANSTGSGEIASIIGRYYAMDRDNRWERTQLAYDLLVRGKGEEFDTPVEALEASYDAEVTDEFVKPKLINSSPDSRIQKDDVIIFYNIRGDRARQITRALTEDNFDKCDVEENLNLHYVTFTSYDDTFEHVEVAYPPLDLHNTIGEVVSNHNLQQLRIAETEKYPHVTYFFNGGDEEPFKGEERILIPSPKVATYDLQPEMSAVEVTDALCAQLITEKHHLGILNYANPDMVGHTGDMDATIKAVETIDQQLKKVVKTATEHNYKILVIADHGNADYLINEDGSPHTAHTSAPVPALILNEPDINMKDGILADVAPTLLKLIGIEQPKEMTGTPLF